MRARWARWRAFVLGLLEYRSDVTTHYGPELIDAYDRGRDVAHRLTRRRYDR